MPMPPKQKCSLILSTGQTFEGELIGAPIASSGELVFTTGMVGYSEAITDPSYYGQILIFTYPLIGNYGIPAKTQSPDLPKGFESQRAQASAVIVNTESTDAYHWNSKETLDAWLKNENVPGITGLDTRHLVHILRSSSRVLGRVVPEGANKDRFEGHRFFDPDKSNLLPAVSSRSRIVMGKGKKRIALIDCGVKWNIVRKLVEFGCEVEILPWDTELDQVDCSGWLISNGPGDPMLTGDLRDRVSSLLQGKTPILGICLGHQILALAAGAKTEKMPYGHRSHNQPVFVQGEKKAYLSTQNHGFAVVRSSIPKDWKIWFLNANDDSVEGLKHKTLPFRSVQFHPEASGGPHDTSWILEEFVSEVKA